VYEFLVFTSSPRALLFLFVNNLQLGDSVWSPQGEGSTSFSQSAGWWVQSVAWTLFHFLLNSPDSEAKVCDCWQDVFQEAQGIVEALEN